MKWIKARLTDISKPKQWKNLPISELTNEGFPVYGANGIIGRYKEYNHEFPTLALTCRGATCGTINITEPKSYITSNAMALDDISEDVDQKFLYYALSKRGFKDVITGAAQPQITREGLSKIVLDIPESKDYQLHIANLLSKAETLISQRKESIRLLDEFLKSTFLEMFGDPVKNEKEFQKYRLGDFIIEIIAGSSYGGEQKEFLKEDEFGVLKVSAVTWGVFNPKEFKVINKNDIKGEIIHPSKGDLLFSRANTRVLVGATCIVDKDYPKLFLPDKLWNLKLRDNELNKVFVHFLFKNKSFKNILTREASGTSGSMLNISMEKLRNIRFPKPPIALQTQFAQIVEKTEALKTQYQQSLQELENLYGSLSQKAFNGELSLKGEGLLMVSEPENNYFAESKSNELKKSKPNF